MNYDLRWINEMREHTGNIWSPNLDSFVTAYYVILISVKFIIIYKAYHELNQ